MGVPEPVFEHVQQAPPEIRAEVAGLTDRWFTVHSAGGAASHLGSLPLRRWISQSSPALFDGSVWLVEGAVLRRLPVGGGAEERFDLPDLSALLASAGMTSHGRELPPWFAPFAGLPAGEQVWKLDGLGAEQIPMSALVLFSPATRAFRLLRRKDGGATHGADLRGIVHLAGRSLVARKPLRQAGGSFEAYLTRTLAGSSIDVEAGSLGADEVLPAEAKPERRMLRTHGAVGSELAFPLADDKRHIEVWRDSGRDLAGPRFAVLSDAIPSLSIPLAKTQVEPRLGLASEAIAGDVGAEGLILSEFFSMPGCRRIRVWSAAQLAGRG